MPLKFALRTGILFFLTLASILQVHAADTPPTIVQAASASPNPVAGNSTILRVLGADDGGEGNLVYTWTAVGTPPSSPVFSINSNNAAKVTQVSLSKAGTYKFQVTIQDGAGQTITSPQLTVTVSKVLTSIVVTPSNSAIDPSGTKQFAASAKDQFGNTMTATLAWSVNAGGSVDGTGLFTSDGTAGTFTVTATSGTISGTNTVRVNAAPSVATPATGSNPVTTKTAALSVLGADDGGEAALKYSWAMTNGPAAVSFNRNNSNAAKSVSATFTTDGPFDFTVTITDARGLSVTSSVTLQVVRSLATITIAPGAATIHLNSTRQFAATGKDQFGTLLVAQPVFNWSVTGQGSIDSNGLYTGPATPGGPFTITAANGAVTDTSTITITNAAPTVAQAINYAPKPLKAKEATLSVLGADDGGEANLTYSWAVTGAPPAPVTLGTNGTNASKNIDAVFTKAGNYDFQVTITDSYGLTKVTTKTVAVLQAITSISVSPSVATLSPSGTQQFSALGFDQFGDPLSTQPTFAWTKSGGGTITTAGLFTAGVTPGGPFSVFAKNGGITGTATVNIVTNTVPSVATAASATQNPVIGTTTSLSVLGADDHGEANLTYTWSATGPAQVSFGTNGNNASKNTVATFTQAGTYTFSVTILDQGGLSTNSSVIVAVNPTLAGLTVAPVNASITINNTQQFVVSGQDQFGVALNTLPAIAWTVTGGGTIDANGLFTATTVGGPFEVRATANAVFGTAAVTVPDTIPPSIAILSPANGNLSNNPKPGIQVSYSDANSGIDISSVGVTLDNQAVPVVGTNTGFTFTPATNLADGSHTLIASIKDVAGNATSAQSTFNIDTVAPSITGQIPSPNSKISTQFPKIGANLSSDVDLSKVQLSLDTQPVVFQASGNSISFTPNVNLNQGTHQVNLTAKDLAGNTSTSTWSFTVDTIVPLITQLTPADGFSVSQVRPSITGKFSDVGTGVNQAAVNILLDALNITGQCTISPSGFSYIPAADLSSGPHTIAVTIADQAGNHATTSATFTVLSSLPLNGPVVVIAAKATPASVTGTSTTLSVQFNDSSGEDLLAYTWETLGNPPAPVCFISNGTNASKSTIATFKAAGQYTFKVTASNADNATASSQVNVSVIQTSTGIKMTPTGAILKTGATKQFTAAVVDQFNQPIDSQPNSFTWSNSGSGYIDQTGLFMAGSDYNARQTITASTASYEGTATVYTNLSFGLFQIFPQDPVIKTKDKIQFYVNGWTGYEDGFNHLQGLAWSVNGGGTIDENGLFTAGTSTGGPYTISSGPPDSSPIRTTTVTVVAPPTVVNPAAAIPNPTSTGFSELSVLGNDDSGESNLTYTWSTVENPPAEVSFSINETNESKNTTAYFSKSGLYTLDVAITNPSGISTHSRINVRVVARPSLEIGASANPHRVINKTTSLSVLGSADAGEDTLVYTWSLIGTPPALVSFSENGTNDAKNTVATFQKAGLYKFRVTIASNGDTVTSDVDVQVDQTISSIKIDPIVTTINTNNAYLFSAVVYDQFIDPEMAPPAVTWSVDDGGTIGTDGLFIAGDATGTSTITATYGDITKTATVNIVGAGSVANLKIVRGLTGDKAGTVDGKSVFYTNGQSVTVLITANAPSGNISGVTFTATSANASYSISVPGQGSPMGSYYADFPIPTEGQYQITQSTQYDDGAPGTIISPESVTLFVDRTGPTLGNYLTPLRVSQNDSDLIYLNGSTPDQNLNLRKTRNMNVSCPQEFIKAGVLDLTGLSTDMSTQAANLQGPNGPDEVPGTFDLNISSSNAGNQVVIQTPDNIPESELHTFYRVPPEGGPQFFDSREYSFQFIETLETHGQYNCHIKLRDKCGNESEVDLAKVFVKRTPPGAKGGGGFQFARFMYTTTDCAEAWQNTEVPQNRIFEAGPAAYYSNPDLLHKWVMAKPVAIGGSHTPEDIVLMDYAGNKATASVNFYHYFIRAFSGIGVDLSNNDVDEHGDRKIDFEYLQGGAGDYNETEQWQSVLYFDKTTPSEMAEFNFESYSPVKQWLTDSEFLPPFDYFFTTTFDVIGPHVAGGRAIYINYILSQPHHPTNSNFSIFEVTDPAISDFTKPPEDQTFDRKIIGSLHGFYKMPMTPDDADIRPFSPAILNKLPDENATQKVKIQGGQLDNAFLNFPDDNYVVDKSYYLHGTFALNPYYAYQDRWVNFDVVAPGVSTIDYPCKSMDEGLSTVSVNSKPGYNWANVVSVKPEIVAVGTTTTFQINAGFMDKTLSFENFNPDGDYIHFLDSNGAGITIVADPGFNGPYDPNKITIVRNSDGHVAQQLSPMVGRALDASIVQTLSVTAYVGHEVKLGLLSLDVNLGRVHSYGDELAANQVGVLGAHRIKDAVTLITYDIVCTYNVNKPDITGRAILSENMAEGVTIADVEVGPSNPNMIVIQLGQVGDGLKVIANGVNAVPISSGYIEDSIEMAELGKQADVDRQSLWGVQWPVGYDSVTIKVIKANGEDTPFTTKLRLIPRVYTPSLNATQLGDIAVGHSDQNNVNVNYFIPWDNFSETDLSSRQRPDESLKIEFEPGIEDRDNGNSFELPLSQLEDFHGTPLTIEIPKGKNTFWMSISGGGITPILKTISVVDLEATAE